MKCGGCWAESENNDYCEREDQCGRPSSIIVVIIAMDGVVKSTGNGNWQAHKIDTLFSALESLTFIILEFHVVSYSARARMFRRRLFNVSHSIDIGPAGRREWNLFGRLCSSPMWTILCAKYCCCWNVWGEARVGRPLIFRLNNILIVFLLGLVIVIKRIRNIKFLLALTLQLSPSPYNFPCLEAFPQVLEWLLGLGFGLYAEQLETPNNTQQQQWWGKTQNTVSNSRWFQFGIVSFFSRVEFFHLIKFCN